MGGGGGPVLVPISTPFGALPRIPMAPGGGCPAPNNGGITLGIDVTAFSPFPLINGDAAAE